MHVLGAAGWYWLSKYLGGENGMVWRVLCRGRMEDTSGSQLIHVAYIS